MFGTGKNSAEGESFAKLVRGDADAIQRLLNQLWEEGKITPITNEIISLPHVSFYAKASLQPSSVSPEQTSQPCPHGKWLMSHS